MRGKKMAEDDEDGFALNKRAGFVGMRGKKWSFWAPREVNSNIDLFDRKYLIKEMDKH